MKKKSERKMYFLAYDTLSFGFIFVFESIQKSNKKILYNFWKCYVWLLNILIPARNFEIVTIRKFINSILFHLLMLNLFA